MTKLLIVDRTKNEMQLLCLLPQRARPFLHRRLRGYNHPDPVLRLLRLFLTRSDVLSEFLLRNSVVGLTIICAYARARPNDLRDERQRHHIPRHLFRKGNYCLAKKRRSFLQIVWMPIAIAWIIGHWDFFGHWSLGIGHCSGGTPSAQH